MSWQPPPPAKAMMSVPWKPPPPAEVTKTLPWLPTTPGFDGEGFIASKETVFPKLFTTNVAKETPTAPTTPLAPKLQQQIDRCIAFERRMKRSVGRTASLWQKNYTPRNSHRNAGKRKL
jgi:hypothetical protein